MNGHGFTEPIASGSSESIWSSILDSVSGTRSVVTKNLIVLGNHKSGKSTLVSRLASATGEASLSSEAESKADVLGLGLSYSCLNVGDESDEDALARLGIYQLPSSLPPYPALLPLALSKSTLLDSLVMIVLDWERPWLFLKELKNWIEVLEGVVQRAGEGWEGAEGRERLETHLRRYSEPQTANASTPTTITSSIIPTVSQLIDMETPLPTGVLSTNLGISLIIVCTKADLINTLERDRDYKEEQFEFIQQTLRTIALRYGAAVFFTSHSRPSSFADLRAYILHRLFLPPPLASANTPLPSSILPPSINPLSATAASPSVSRSFPFTRRVNVVDRDRILVPSGWDTWGKIKILRERYEPDSMGQGWENDMESSRSRTRSHGSDVIEDTSQHSAIRIYGDVVVDLDDQGRSINTSDQLIVAQDQSTFLQAHYETIQKDREKDPRNAFAARSTTNGYSDSGMSSLSNVRDSDEMAARLAKVRKDTSNGGTALSPSLSATSPPLGTSPVIASSASLLSGSSSATGGQAQNEVLANFFQSLLTAKTTGGSRSAGGVQDLASKSS